MDSTTTTYAFRDPAAEGELGGSANVAGRELDRIRVAHNGLRPADVVDESRPEDAPLHPVFEWQDPIAAERWREHQARDLIRQVVVVPQPQEEGWTQVRLARPLTDQADVEVSDYDPLAEEVREATGRIIEAKRQLEALREKAHRRYDRKRVIAAGVALKDLDDAQELLTDAGEALTAARRQAVWPSAQRQAVTA